MCAPHYTTAPRPLRSGLRAGSAPPSGFEGLEAVLLAGEVGAQRCRKWVEAGWVTVGRQVRPQGRLSSLWLYLGASVFTHLASCSPRAPFC